MRLSTSTTPSNLPIPCLGRRRLAAALGAGLLLAGCGGGVAVGRAGLQLVITAGVLGYAPVLPGPTIDVVAPLGQPVAVDANEPVLWRFAVAGGSPLFQGGSVVTVGGVTLTLSQLTPSRAVVETSAAGLALLPLFVLLTATSTFDAAQVASVRLRIG